MTQLKKVENKSQQDLGTQGKSQNKPKESFISTGNDSSIRSRSGSWFECKVRYKKTQEDGSDKTVTELYIVDALSFTEAEASIIDEMAVYVSGELKVQSINRSAYNEIFFTDNIEDDLWFKARLAFITTTEKSNKEKRTYVNYLVQAKSIERAKRYIDIVMGKSMIDYELKNLDETKVMDVFEHKTKPEDYGFKKDEEKGNTQESVPDTAYPGE